MVAARLRCRCAPEPRPGQHVETFAEGASISAGCIERDRAAAISSASGTPSSRRHRRDGVELVVRDGGAGVAGPVKEQPHRAVSTSASRPGHARGPRTTSARRAGPAGIGWWPAPWATRTPPAARRSPRPPSVTCSQLSTTTRAGCSAGELIRASNGREPELAGDRSADRVGGRRPGSGRRSGRRARNDAATRRDIARASAVFPMPAGPMTVTSRRSASRATTALDLRVPADQLHRHRRPPVTS